MGEMRNSCNILVGKPEGKKTLRRPRRRWEDIRMDLREIGWQCVDCMDQEPVADPCECGNETSASIKGGGNFLIRYLLKNDSAPLS
jgi:hypothetical protein